MQEPDYFNLITPQLNDKTLDVEISFTDKRGIKDKDFRDQVVDEIYDIIFRELELTSFGIKFNNNRETISFKMVEEKNDPLSFSMIYEQLCLLADTEPNFTFSIKGIPFEWTQLIKKMFDKYGKNM